MVQLLITCYMPMIYVLFLYLIRTATAIKLLNICNDYCELHDLTFNAKKSMCMYFSIYIYKHCGLLVIKIPGQFCTSNCEGS